MQRPRGRPSKASLAAAAGSRDSASSITTSKDSESVSGRSTPLTSNSATPAESTYKGKLEVVIPFIKSQGSAASAEAMQRAKDYMLGKDKKKKRIFSEIADSEDDDNDLEELSPAQQRLRQDELIARQLQDALNQEDEDQGAFAIDADDSDDLSTLSDPPEISDSSIPVTKGKGKGKAKANAPRPRGRPSKKMAVQQPEDDEEEDGEDYPDSDDFEPLAKKRKVATPKGKGKGKGKGRAKRLALPDSDADSSDSIPRK